MILASMEVKSYLWMQLGLENFKESQDSQLSLRLLLLVNVAITSLTLIYCQINPIISHCRN